MLQDYRKEVLPAGPENTPVERDIPSAARHCPCEGRRNAPALHPPNGSSKTGMRSRKLETSDQGLANPPSPAPFRLPMFRARHKQFQRRFAPRGSERRRVFGPAIPWPTGPSRARELCASPGGLRQATGLRADRQCDGWNPTPHVQQGAAYPPLSARAASAGNNARSHRCPAVRPVTPKGVARGPGPARSRSFRPARWRGCTARGASAEAKVGS